ncbi:hypothetical protein [Vibrio paracholerae]|uniref:hypothetical protein n=1 Tax=Vibrio paracholerae TaxID=650003 RepID=UPI000DE41828|nr:hypothetical protein [Vibrio paracholerae]RBM83956.1 hypothetical protein DLR74_18310 [Vibrio paracholerae]
MNQYRPGSTKNLNNSNSGNFPLSTTQLNEVDISRCARQLKSFIIADDFIEGEVTKSQLYLEQLHSRGQHLFREVFLRVWVELFSVDNPKHLYTFISVSSCIPYEWLKHHGDALILGCCSHDSTLVNESCIRLAESWENPQHADQLEKMREFQESWLESYRLQTINYLKGLN